MLLFMKSILEYIGSSLLVILISYITVDTINSKKVDAGIIIGRVVMIIILYLCLGRTK